MNMIKRRKSSFYPVGSLENKRNYKEYFILEKDGSIVDKVFLDIIDPSRRELIICLHYMRHVVRNFYAEDVGINITSRDAPWDFGLELSTGEQANIEITSITDVTQNFKTHKSEERYTKWKNEKMIPFHELKKLSRLFSSSSLLREVESLEKNGFKNTDMVENPMYGESMTMFVGNMPESEVSLSEILKEAIDKKANKKHSEKEQTTLIIDNRAYLFEVNDFYLAAEELNAYCASLAFPEVWFYTGYFSDGDGNNAEFSFAPLKVTSQQSKILENMAESKNIDESGKYVW
ncbi:hypothetical protein Swoo_3772 [Shewanella woodyi ATCC 51908]|uniref:Uncharacterized protein n=2 Tax=Shewanella woodyi TaxID=60961 RepID=B1KEL6_SHEWM|nr:hypothetical protein Swoo_3772 [Shewanella woodyi ATCC 51908]